MREGNTTQRKGPGTGTKMPPVSRRALVRSRFPEDKRSKPAAKGEARIISIEEVKKRNLVEEMSKPIKLNSKMAEKTREYVEVGHEIGKESVDVGKKITKGTFSIAIDKFKNIMEKSPLVILTPLLIVFTIFGFKSGLDFLTNLFGGNKKDSPPLVWQGLKLLFGATMATGVYKTISGRGTAFKSWKSVFGGTAACVGVKALNDIYVNKGQASKVSDIITHDKSASNPFKRFMDFFNPFNVTAGGANPADVDDDVGVEAEIPAAQVKSAYSDAA